MSDPFSLFPLALAAGGGRIDGIACQQLVAAGVTLLQRSAPLVRALSGRRSGILLPSCPAYITALAASDGRGAVLVNPSAVAAEVARQLSDANVGAVLTASGFAEALPPGMPIVLLDDAPRSARVMTDGRARDIDLGSHVGLSLEGSRDAEGRDEECVVLYASVAQGTRAEPLTHRQLINDARSTAQTLGLTPVHNTFAESPFWERVGLVTLAAAMMTGGRITTVAARTE